MKKLSFDTGIFDRFFMYAFACIMIVALFTSITIGLHAEPVFYDDWAYITQADPITDADTSFIVTISSNSERMMTVRKMSDGINVMYMLDRFFAGDSDSDIKVLYRIDSKPATDYSYWNLSQDNTAAFARMYNVRPIMRDFSSGSKVIFRAIDLLDGEIITDHFSLNGFTAAFNRLLTQ